MVALLLFVAGSASAAWYGGGSLGATSFQESGVLGVGVDSVDGSDSDFGWKLHGGYRFLPFLGVEAGYASLSSSDFVVTGDLGGFGEVRVDVRDVTARYVAAVGRVPIGTKFAVFGKAGLAAWEADVERLEIDFIELTSDDGVDLMTGLGAEFQVIRFVRVRVEWERYESVADADVDMFSLGVTFGLPLP